MIGLLKVLDTAIKAIESFSKYKKEKKETKEKFFQEFISPLFEQLEICHNNSKKFLHGMIAIIEHDKNWIKSINKIREHRNSFKTKRDSLAAYSSFLRDDLVRDESVYDIENKNPSIHAAMIFLNSLTDFFHFNVGWLPSDESENMHMESKYPSLADFVKSNRIKTKGSVQGVMVDIFEFLSYQELQFGDSAGFWREREKELKEFIMEIDQRLDNNWYDLCCQFMRLRLLIFGSESLL